MQLSRAQKEVVEYTDGPQIILAGAGSGKTGVIVAKAQYLIEQKGYEPSSLLVITFSTKTQAELEGRMASLSHLGGIPEIRTFHALGMDILAEFGRLIGLPRDVEKASEYRLWQYLKQAIAELSESTLMDTNRPEQVRHDISSFISRAKDELVEPAEIISKAQERLRKLPPESDHDNVIVERERWSAVLEAGKIYQSYERIKSETGTIDYGDMLILAHRLLAEQKIVGATLRKRFRYILVDEFQDTNYAQVQILHLLAGDTCGVTVVGDDDQAIYRFRGASFGAFKLFEKLFPDMKTFELQENYRSSPNIVLAAQSLIETEPEARFKKDKKMKAVAKSGAKVLVRICPDELSEAESVADEITVLLKKSEFRKPASIAILFRARRHKDLVAEALERRGIEFYYDRTILEAISKSGQLSRALYEFTVDDSRNDLLVPIIRHFVPGLNARAEREIWYRVSRGDGDPLESLKAAASSLDDSLSRQVEFLAELLERFRQLAKDKTPLQLMEKIIAEAGILSAIVTDGKLTDPQAAADVSALLNKASEFATENPFPTHAGFLEYLAWDDIQAEETTSELETQAPVVLQTVHGSKGLEYPAVFMIGLSNRKFPQPKRYNTPEFPPELYRDELPAGDFRIQEERRLFYVGMTRARKLLYLYGIEKKGTRISRFVTELQRSPSFEKVAVREAVAKSEPELIDTIVSDEALADPKPSVIISAGDDFESSLSQGLLELWKKRAVSARDESEFEKSKERFKRKLTEVISSFEQKLDSHFFSPPEKPPRYTVERISYTDIEAFETCPLSFYFQKVLSLPTPVSPFAIFGSVIHRVLQEAGRRLQEGNMLSLENLINDFENRWRRIHLADPDQKQRLQARGKLLLERFVNRQSELSGRPMELEKSFAIDLGEFKLTGRIDRIDKTSRGLEIIDYKTGKQDPAKLRTDLQLKIYALACQRMFGECPDRTMYMYLGDDSIHQSICEATELEDVADEIIGKVADINASEFPANPGYHCGTCAYAGICPAKET